MTVVELDFGISGSSLPADHGYPLFSALSESVPEIHEADWLGIHTLPGVRDGHGSITLPSSSKLRLRLPMEKIPIVYPLAGKKICVGDYTLRLGIPQIRLLAPAQTLWSRLVVLKLADSKGQTAEPESFLAGVQRQLEALSIAGKPSLEKATQKPGLDAFARRVLRIKGVTITGYGIYVSGLSDEDSLKLQIAGIGGRRRMGCGLFVPVGGQS
ncbi:type I-MYXAN CRISPR-associated protein Cas6/Cmx6 [Gloeobacter kilaueensis]|uniref:CRISPR-associated protein Cas6 n=1 Tax=Gloeobacter kilaueensis (strain ATCC BAA-2537 / CCAP 1431/1 / ULC 316 / JS1) TaxID=1183438 RepID=U5QID9_GLOK1|nr:type I-MYXAN CRISPR-associated protein Cas6/Cmx6 [Gloeobacter kilaueensis]AGY58701.1 hypothetical protein GKIL_2455 [Gloeobacter kilaueensis JS1]